MTNETKVKRALAENRKREVAFVKSSSGDIKGPYSYHNALRVAKAELLDLLARQKGQGWQHAFALVFRKQSGTLTVELARYVVDRNGRIVREFPAQKVTPSLSLPDEQGPGGGRQLLITVKQSREN